MNEIGIGILGFGTVGAGVAEGLLNNTDLLTERLGVRPVLRKIADLDITTDRGVQVPDGILTTDAESVINDPSIQVIVELIGGSGIARTFVKQALEAGKAVVTANKKLLAEYGHELFPLAEANNVDLYFEASVGGGIPIIRSLREGLVGDHVHWIRGILNGTCNYILTRMENEGLDFEIVLDDAQKLGYAEADPSTDVDGFDAAHKASLLAGLAYGFYVPFDQIMVEGIRGLSRADVQHAADLGYRIKHLAVIKRHDNDIEVRVHPALVPQSNALASVNDVFNAVMVNSDMADDTLYYGRGAGRRPTASAVIGDIGDIARNLGSGNSFRMSGIPVAAQAPTIRPVDQIKTRYYLRLSVADRPSALSQITSKLGEHGVSIASALQKESPEPNSSESFIPIIIVTHLAREAEVNSALQEISALDAVNEPPVKLRIED